MDHKQTIAQRFAHLYGGLLDFQHARERTRDPQEMVDAAFRLWEVVSHEERGIACAGLNPLFSTLSRVVDLRSKDAYHAESLLCQYLVRDVAVFEDSILLEGVEGLNNQVLEISKYFSQARGKLS